MIPLANDTDKLRAALNSSSSYAVVDGVHGPSYGAGIIFVLYLAEQGSKHFGKQIISYGEEVDNTAYINVSNLVLTLNEGFKGELDLENYAEVTTIDATKLSEGILVKGNVTSKIINLGNGDDTLYAGSNSGTVSGGAGSDLFVVNEATGDLTINDYTASQDRIQLGNYAVLGEVAVVDGDVQMRIGNGSVLVKDGAGKKITVIDSEGTSTTQIYDEDPIWRLSDSTATYGTTTKTLVTVSGVKFLSGLALNNKVVTVSNDALNQSTVTVSNGYTLALGSDVAKPSTTAAGWTSKSGTYTYTAAKTSAGYSLASNKISYTSASGGEQFSLTGLKNTSAVTVSGKKVTVGKNSLNGKAVTLTGDYTLAFAKDVATSAKKTAGAFSTVSKDTATYKATFFSGYYKLSGKKISYTAASGGQAITLKNLNTSANLAAIKKGITVAEQSNGNYKITFQNAGVLTTKAPTVSAAKGLKYTVAVADSLKPVTKAAAWNISGTSAILRSDTTAGYTVGKNAVVYSAKKNGSPLVELTNLAKNVKASAITTKGKVITLNTSVLGAKTAIKSNSGKYSFNLTGNMSKKQFIATSAADTLAVAANNASIDSGAGNDVVTVSGLKVTLNGGAGNDTLTITGKNAVVFGGGGADTIKSTSSGATINGGKGDDQLWGSKKFSDVFIYNKGDDHDTIRFFEKNDLLQITGTFSASYNSSKKEIYFNVGSTAKAITLKEFGSTTTFHVNNDTYQISGTKLVKK